MSRRSSVQGNVEPAQEKVSEQMSQKRLEKDVSEGSTDMDDKTAVKPGHQEPLSDSENEEPFSGRAPHKSAFVSRNNTSYFTSFPWNIQSKLERSQSCSDTAAEILPIGRRRTVPLHKAKAPSLGGGAVGLIGVLLSTENSRSFSAPILTSEKRVTINALNSFTPLHKPERSISPESNDSISEELNHFKPIVCSPCTPPKRLPDGRVLSPVIIKSTPRNLRRNLQKPTTYEASPVILKKWEQVFRDRQMKKTMSKGTLTSSTEDGLSVKTSASRELLLCKTSGGGRRSVMDGELLPSSSKEEASRAGLHQPGVPCGDCLQRMDPPSQPLTTTEFLDGNAKPHATTKTKLPPRLTSNKKTISQCKCSVPKPIKPTLKRAHKKNPQPVQNGSCFPTAENISPAFPQRRGQKRRCKTKHLEQNGALKRLRVACRQGCSQGGLRRLWRATEGRLHQVEEDRKLALKLQQRFDKETRMVNRGKGSRDEYPLRSKSTAGEN